MAVIASTFTGACAAGEIPSFNAPETGWTATWTSLEGTGARAHTLVITDADRVMFDGSGIELRERDYNFAFWNGARELLAYSSDVGVRVLRFNPDGTEHELAWSSDVGCIDLDDRVTLDDRQMKAIERILCP